jgi:hypothetical protein
LEGKGTERDAPGLEEHRSAGVRHRTKENWMRKLFRSTLMAGVLAIGVAACGDDVEVTDPGDTPHPPLTVALSGVSINVGESANLAAQVSGGNPEASTSWVCETSNENVVSVTESDTGCLVTGEGNGNTTVTVTVDRGAMSASASAQVTVAQLTQAQVSIHDVRQGGSTADIDNVSGQLDVVINVEPGDETPVQLDLLVDEDVVASQQFSQAQIAELQEAAEAAEASEAPVQITLSFNTGYYEIVDGAAHIRSYNGPREISANLHVAQLETAPRASNTVTVTFRNTDGLHVVGGLPDNSVLDGEGRRWYGGWGEDEGADLHVIPVFYSHPDRGAQNVMVSLCPGESETLAEGPFEYSFSCAGFESERSSNGVAPVITTQYDDSGNNGPSEANILNEDHPFPVRIDNAAPGLGNSSSIDGVLFIASQSGVWNRENWINDEYDFATGLVAANAAYSGGAQVDIEHTDLLTNEEITDGGSSYQGEIDVQFVATNNGDTILVDSPADLDESNTNSHYRLHVVLTDALGNDRLITQIRGPWAYSASSDPDYEMRNAMMVQSHYLNTFGVDRSVPTLVESDEDEVLSFGEDYIVNSFTDPEVEQYVLDFSVTDQVSGFARVQNVDYLGQPYASLILPGDADEAYDRALLHVSAQIRGTPGSSALNYVSFAGLAGTEVDDPFATSGAGELIGQPDPDMAVSYTRELTQISYTEDWRAIGFGDDPSHAGYFIVQLRAQDKAGNRTPLHLIRVYLNAGEQPEISGINPGGFYAGGDEVSFPATSDDRVEILSGSFALGYDGIGWLLSDRNPTTIGELFTDEINRPADYAYTTDLGFIRTLSVVDGADMDRPTDDRVKPTAVEGRVYSGYSWETDTYWGDDFIHLHDDEQVSNHLFDANGGLGFSSLFQANLLDAQVEDGQAFPFGAVATEGNQVIGPTDVDEDEGSTDGSRGWFADRSGDNLRATVRGVSGQFNNPFAAVVVVARVLSVDNGVEYLVPASSVLASPSSQLDSGQNRDYYFDWAITGLEDDFPGGELCGYHVVGLSADYDGLATVLWDDDGAYDCDDD